jgi:hypothetical protein
MSGRPGSNRPPIAWKAIALPNELLPLLTSFSGNLLSRRVKLLSENIKELIRLADRFLIIIPDHHDRQCGQERIRTSEVEDSGFTVRPIWPLWNLPCFIRHRVND